MKKVSFLLSAGLLLGATGVWATLDTATYRNSGSQGDTPGYTQSKHAPSIQATDSETGEATDTTVSANIWIAFDCANPGKWDQHPSGGWIHTDSVNLSEGIWRVISYDKHNYTSSISRPTYSNSYWTAYPRTHIILQSSVPMKEVTVTYSDSYNGRYATGMSNSAASYNAGWRYKQTGNVQTYYNVEGSNELIMTPDTEAHITKIVVADRLSFTPEDENWVEVNVESAGSLGVEVLYKEGIETLADVKRLRVTGQLNETDITTIQNMTALQSLDMTGTIGVTSLPNDWKQNSVLSEVFLPSTIRQIGNNAFRSSQLNTFTIPAGVESIGSSVFYACRNLYTINFEQGCKLATIGNNCFEGCWKLQSVSLPDGVTVIPISCFEECMDLDEVKLPAELTEILDNAFRHTTQLKNISFPESLRNIAYRVFENSGLETAYLPADMTTMGSYAFQSCKSLTEVTLPGKLHLYNNYQFSGCSALMKINCPAATPPTVTNASIAQNAGATVYVPDAAVVNYKIDGFWKNFNVQGGFNADYYEIDSDMLLTNDRRFDGKPEIDLIGGAKMTVGGNAPMEMRAFSMLYDHRTSNAPVWAQFINNSPAVSADAAVLKMDIYGGRWYFFSAPFTCNVSEITANNKALFALRYYDGATRAANGTGGSWKDVPQDGVLEAGKGYIIQSNTECRITFTSKADEMEAYFNPNARIVTLDLNESENPANAGWNLVGNPFQSHYDMYYSMLTCPVIIWDASASKYQTLSLIDDEVVLTPYMPFFMQASAETESIEFSTAGRQFDKVVNRPAAATALDGQSSERMLFNLTLEAGDRSDRTRVVLNEDATLGYDIARDAAKFLSDNKTVAELYTIDASGNRLSINERPMADGFVRLGVSLPNAGKFSIGAKRLDGYAELIDALTGKTYILTDGSSIEFDSETAGFIDNRFSLRLKATPTAVEGIGTDAKVNILATEGGIEIVGAEGHSFTVCALDGTMAAQGICATRHFVPLAQGVYIVRVATRATKCIVK